MTSCLPKMMFCAALLASPALAQSTQGVLVELFTSQGCSSCPPADEYLAELAQDPDVIPLALHVDYWDYIGWTDTFAQDKFTRRQRKYAAQNADRMVYTPQMIVAGTARIKGHDAQAVDASIASSVNALTLPLTRQGDRVTIHAVAAQPIAGDVLVDLVRYHPKSTVQIERGENRGLSVSYANIVTEWQNIGTWDGKGDLQMSARATGTAPIVVILQRPGPAQVLAAAVLK